MSTGRRLCRDGLHPLFLGQAIAHADPAGIITTEMVKGCTQTPPHSNRFMDSCETIYPLCGLSHDDVCLRNCRHYDERGQYGHNGENLFHVTVLSKQG